ncbi:MAG: cardiolipin synthase [Ruminococcaceae bacterium]|nr:cardiolipin synthase [Oscillospiraceae bacterium]
MKGILKLFTSRMILTAINILAQFAIIFVLVAYFDGVFVYYYSISLILSMLCCVYVINKNMNSAYKIAWILLLLLLPMFGLTLYIMLEGSWYTKQTKRKMLSITHRIKDILGKGEKISFKDSYAQKQSRYIEDFAYSSPVKNTRAKYFSCGEGYFASLLNDLKTAQKSIYVEYFIIKESHMWDEIKAILKEKAKNGVDVRVIYDDFGSIDRISKKEIKALISSGIRVKAFNPFVPAISLLLNYRDHRKICTIDTKIAYSGGVNLADEYINREIRFGHWKDSGIALYGEGAYSFEVFFLTLWEYITKEKQSLVKPEYEEIDEGVFQPYTDSPIDEENVGASVYMNIISQAQKYVYISTPYFVVDDEMLKVITNAAKSGVDVRIVVPHIPDKKIVNQATKSYYTRLIKAGVKVYEYKHGFNHSKIVVSDGKIANVGSVNFDFRSFYLSFECGVWMYNTPVVLDVLADYNNLLSQSIKISLEDCKASPFVRAFRAVIAAFSPLF